MNKDGKVININTLTRFSRAAATAGSAGEVQHFSVLESRCTPALKPLLQSLFDNIDDALFELADRAVQNTVQNMYFESMREIRIKRSALENNFFDELQAHFALLQAGPGSPPVLSQLAPDADSLALVAQDELEELVATEAMIAKASRQFSTEIATMNRYIEALLAADNVEQTLNPLTPQTICRVFIKCCGDLDVEIKAKLVLFKLFERYVLAELAPVYKMACSVLITAAKTYRLEPVDQRDKSQHPNVTNESPPTSPAQDSAQHPSQNISEQESESQTQSLFSDLQSMMRQLPSSAYSSSSIAGSNSALLPPGQGRPISREKLFDLLQLIQRSSEEQWQQQEFVAPASLDIIPLLDQVIADSSPSTAMSMGQLDDDAINLVAMLFQYILDDRNLAAAIKGLICRLQIPIVKVAMLDKTFFSKVGHPARRLLNEIAYASMGWSAESDFASDPLYRKVSEVVSRLAEDNSIEQFHEVLTDFVAFVEIAHRRTQLVEQRIINAEDGKAKTEHARSIVQSLLAEKMAGRTLAPAVENLLLEPWSNVLLLRYLRREQEPELWQQALQSVDDLLWSVGGISGEDSRRRLIALIPPLLKQLRIGLMAIAYNQFDMNALFVELESIHLAQIKAPLDCVYPQQQAAPTQPRLDDLQQAGNTLQPSLEQLDAQLDAQLAGFGAMEDFPLELASEPVESLLATTDEHTVVAERPVASVDHSILRAVDNLATGSWVEVHQQDGKKFRCRLAAIIRGTEKYIFVNRAGMKVAEHHRLALIEVIGRGEMSLLDEGLLFDRALESVIGSLRSRKTGSD